MSAEPRLERDFAEGFSHAGEAALELYFNTFNTGKCWTAAKILSRINFWHKKTNKPQSSSVTKCVLIHLTI